MLADSDRNDEYVLIALVVCFGEYVAIEDTDDQALFDSDDTGETLADALVVADSETDDDEETVADAVSEILG